MSRALFVILVLLSALLVAASLLPLIPTEWWAARLLDFPRLQIAAGLIVLGLAWLPYLRSRPRASLALLILIGAAVAVNAAILWPYRPSGGDTIATCQADRRLAVLVANVQLGNREAAPLLEAVRRAQPDLFLAMETDAWWDEALKPLTGAMPYTLKQITGSYYGIQFFSRLPLVAGEIRHLAGADTPAVVTGVRMPTGEVVDFVGLHPKPPQVLQSALGRDAQLYAAAAVLRARIEPGILAGDLNATPWEIAVERMGRLAGLIDPRRGYGYVATWNAQSSWARWPLDHVLHQGGFATLSIERLPGFGSDHFPYLVRLCRTADSAGEMPPAADAGDVAAANDLLARAGASARFP